MFKEPNANDSLEQSWFNEMVNAEKDPTDFDNLMGSTINFTKFAKNCLKKDKLTKANLEGPAFALLKGGFKNHIELENNMEQCYLTLTGQIDWVNPEGDRCTYDLSNPLPLQGPLGLTKIYVDFFFNQDLEYLKTGNKDKKYVVSLTKPKAARYDLKGLEKMIPKLWNSSKVGYDLNAAYIIHHWGPKRLLFYRFRYGYLKEIMVRRANQKEYTFNEAYFKRLHLNEIEDMLPLMPPKRMSTSEAPAMTQAAIRKLVADSVTAALEAQAANMANTDNTTRPREALVARQCSYKEFMSCQPINFKGMEGAIGLIYWFERTESVFSRNNCTEDCKVKFATGTLTEESLSWCNYFAQPIGIEEAYKITWVEFKKLLIKKYCPRTEVQKMEDEFYHLIVKGNDLKTYVRRF
ncbi:hypothetical protein Tco_0298348 [Tanacetum coccineum]